MLGNTNRSFHRMRVLSRICHVGAKYQQVTSSQSALLKLHQWRMFNMNIFNGSSYEYICRIQAGEQEGRRNKRSFHCSQAISDKECRGGKVQRKYILLKPTQGASQQPDFRKKWLVYGTNTILSCRWSCTFTTNVTSGVSREALAMGTPHAPVGDWVLEQHRAPNQWQFCPCEALAPGVTD